MPMYDYNQYKAAGLPVGKNILKYSNMVDQEGKVLTPDIKNKKLDYDNLFSIMREQNRIETIERYMWLDLPPGINADIIERILYYRGKGVLYFNDNVGKFQFLPFSLNGLIDEYGRYLNCKTLPFTGVEETKNKNKKNKDKLVPAVYENLDLVYDLPYNKEMLQDIKSRKVVGIILNDSSLGVSQQPIIRYNYVEPVLHLMATVMQLINTAIYGCADHNLLQVENESEYDSVNSQIDAINTDILRGKRFTAIVGKLPITPIKTSSTSQLEGLFGTFNSLTNFLKSITGIANAGVFDKKEHLLQEEQRLNGSNSDDIYYNGLRKRQEFCLLIQAYYGYPTWCESKRGMSGAQEENYLMGETSDPDNTQANPQMAGAGNES